MSTHQSLSSTSCRSKVPKPHVRVSVTMPKDELSNLRRLGSRTLSCDQCNANDKCLRQLVQASAAAGADLPLVLLGLLASDHSDHGHRLGFLERAKSCSPSQGALEALRSHEVVDLLQVSVAAKIQPLLLFSVPEKTRRKLQLCFSERRGVGTGTH